MNCNLHNIERQKADLRSLRVVPEELSGFFHSPGAIRKASVTPVGGKEIDIVPDLISMRFPMSDMNSFPLHGVVPAVGDLRHKHSDYEKHWALLRAIRDQFSDNDWNIMAFMNCLHYGAESAVLYNSFDENRDYQIHKTLRKHAKCHLKIRYQNVWLGVAKQVVLSNQALFSIVWLDGFKIKLLGPSSIIVMMGD